MPFEFAYQVVKDIADLMKMIEAEPVNAGRHDLVTMGIVVEGNRDQYRWSVPHNLYARTEALNASYEIVWVIDKLRRTKRKVTRFKSDGAIDAVLIRRR